MTQTMVNAKPLLIGGEWRTTERTLTSYNPATGEALGTVCVGGAAEIDAAVQAARSAFPAWRAAGESGRTQALRRLHRVLAERRDEIAGLINRENGKPLMEALSADVLVSLDSLAYYLKHGTRELAPERIKLQQRLLFGHRAEVVYEPAGVIGIIAPWNVPLAIPFSQLTAALILGNTVVLKPSEWTPLIGHAIAQLCVAAELPPGVVNVVMGDGVAGAALAGHPGTNRIVFTGSVATGKQVAVACAQRLCPCVLELGGVGAALVRADADPRLAARGVVWSRFVNNGQVCVATQRVYVNQQIAQPFVGDARRNVRAAAGDYAGRR
jgi:succinate-semialdehyde dehydrogenase / glutarate-semialdehyde dehydrogenase